jgi:hypothetical protein
LDSAGVPVSRYVAGGSYNITITGVNNSTSSLRGFGFQLTAVNTARAGTTSATQAGTFPTTGLPTGCQNTGVGSLRLIEQSSRLSPSTGTGGTGTTYSRSIPWTAPSAGTGAIVLYGVINAVDASGATGGDKWNTRSLSIGELTGSVSAITGPSSVCQGSQITLFDSTAGGTWTSANTSIATIGSTSGIVTGVGRGSVVISYTASGGTATTTITVNPLPGPITGPDAICVSSTGTYVDTPAGGAWAISPTSVATISTGTSTGIVTGVSAGTATISYTTAAGCRRTRAITINSLAASISGPTHVCVNSTTNYTIDTGAITWSCTPTTVATINTSTGLLTAIAPGTVVVTAIKGGCTRTLTVNVNPLPSRISGPTTGCVGNVLTYTDSTTGGSWSSSNTAIATAVPTSGIVRALSAGSVSCFELLRRCDTSKSGPCGVLWLLNSQKCRKLGSPLA